MARPPQYVRRFADLLRSARVERLEVPGTRPLVQGQRGILTTTKLQYVERSWQLLGRDHEYTFWLPGPRTVELSVQLYENLHGHWKIFVFCPAGILLELNMTTMRGRATRCRCSRLSE